MLDETQRKRSVRNDSLEMKIGVKNIKSIIQTYYVERLMKCEDVANIIMEKFGVSCSDDAVLRVVNKLGVKRSKAKAISLSRCKLDSNKIMTDRLVGIIDGMMFGDGYLEFNQETKVARIKIGSCHEECSLYYSDLLHEYGCSEPSFNSGLKGIGMWSVYTKFHPDLYEQRIRWYPGGVKQIPADIEFTPEMILLWYLGDGCLSSPLEGNARYMYFATNCFSKDSLERIVVPKFSEIGVEVARITDDSRVFIATNSINKLLQYMGGKSPVKCFDYKFDIEEWRTFMPMKEVAIKANIDYGRLSNWVKQGYIEHSRSPGGKKVVFSEDQFKKLLSRLDSGELPRESGKKNRIISVTRNFE